MANTNPFDDLSTQINCAFASMAPEVVAISAAVAEKVVAQIIQTGAVDVSGIQSKLTELEALFASHNTADDTAITNLLNTIVSLRARCDSEDSRLVVLEALSGAHEALKTRVHAVEDDVEGLKGRVEALENAATTTTHTVDLTNINDTLGLHTTQIANADAKAEQAKTEANNARSDAAQAAVMASQAAAAAAAAAQCCNESVKTADVVAALAGIQCDSLIASFKTAAQAAMAVRFPDFI